MMNGFMCQCQSGSSSDSADTGLGSPRSLEDETCGWTEGSSPQLKNINVSLM